MFKDRTANLKRLIKKERVDALFISSASTIEYLSGYSNFSKEEREAYIFIGENFGCIITDGRYTEAVKKEVPHLEVFERGTENTLEKLFKKQKNKIKNLGIEEDDLTVLEHKFLKKHFKNLKHFNVSHIRSIKDTDEINKIKRACEIGDLAFKLILKKIKKGISEKELFRELEKFIKDKGVEFSFPAIVAFGKNSSIPHHQTGNTRLLENNIILLDFGVRNKNYCSDMTRTIFFGSSDSSKKNDFTKVYKTVLEAQQKAVNYINSQLKNNREIKASDVDKTAREYIKSKGYPDIPHSLGHGIGLQVHEHPFISSKSKDVLKEGMVFSIEPGIYIPGFGGVRIEDLYVLEKDGLEQLTTSLKEVIQI